MMTSAPVRRGSAADSNIRFRVQQTAQIYGAYASAIRGPGQLAERVSDNNQEQKQQRAPGDQSPGFAFGFSDDVFRHGCAKNAGRVGAFLPRQKRTRHGKGAWGAPWREFWTSSMKMTAN
jgi:hypothetical protein